MVRHHRNRIVEPDDLTDAVDGLGRSIIHALHPPAEHGRLGQRCDLHAGRPRIDTVDRGAVDLGGRI
jgi:hypothetical protein